MIEQAKGDPMQGFSKTSARRKWWRRVLNHWEFYLLLLPMFVIIFVFKYVPMYGVQIAFKEFKASLGIMASPWAEPIGKHFLKFFHSYNFERLVTNTFLLSFETLIFSLIPQSISPRAKTMRSSLVRLCGGKSPRSSAMTERICMI